VPAVSSELTERELYARDAYESVTALSVLLLLWSGVRLLSTGAPGSGWPFEVVRASHLGFALFGLVFVGLTWRKPQVTFAIVFSCVAIAASIVFVPWAALASAQEDRLWEAAAGAQLAMASIPLITPRFLWLGCILLGGLATATVVTFLLAAQLGISPMPAGEPFLSLSMGAIGLAVLFLREQRRRIGLEYIRTEADTRALSQIGPLLVSVRAQLDADLAALSEDVPELPDEAKDGPLKRALGRLASLRQQLEDLEQSPSDPGEAARQLQIRDSYVGVTYFAIGALLANTINLWSAHNLALGYAWDVLWIVEFVFLGVLIWLSWNRRAPSARRALWAGLVLFLAAMCAICSAHVYWVRLPQPAQPFIGHKLLLAALVLIRPRRLWLGVLLVAVVGAEAIALQSVLAPTAPFSPLEPWHTLLFVVLALGLLFMGEQRRVASLQLIRKQAEASSLFRRASMFLALKDRLNSPIQTLVLRNALLEQTGAPPAILSRLQAAVDNLVSLSQQVAQVTGVVRTEHYQASLDAEEALRRRR
jgi:hypothetical protein